MERSFGQLKLDSLRVFKNTFTQICWYLFAFSEKYTVNFIQEIFQNYKNCTYIRTF